jgi:hypothetical protein
MFIGVIEYTIAILGKTVLEGIGMPVILHHYQRGSYNMFRIQAVVTRVPSKAIMGPGYFTYTQVLDQ